MSYNKALLFLAAVVVASSAEDAARVKKQILVSAIDDGSYWPGKYDVRELSPALGALPDGVAVRTAIPAAIPAALPAALHAGIPATLRAGIPAALHAGIPAALPALAAPYPYLI